MAMVLIMSTAKIGIMVAQFHDADVDVASAGADAGASNSGPTLTCDPRNSLICDPQALPHL